MKCNKGFYRLVSPVTYEEQHGGASIKTTHYKFIKFNSNGYFVKINDQDPNFNFDAVADRRLYLFLKKSNDYTNAIVTVGTYKKTKKK